MIVVDTNVLVAGMASSKGYSFRLLERMLNEKIDYLMSLKLLSEYWSVLTRHENMQRFPLSLSEIETVLALLVQNATYQEVYYRWRPNLKDENDNFILELAVAGHAEGIVTFNKKDFESTELKFDLFVKTPREFMKGGKTL